MRLIALTGGIGAGKSTVARGLADRGATVVDADGIAREVVEPGGPAFAPLVARFGPSIVGPDGGLERAALARIAFADHDALSDLNHLTHPAIGEVIAERIAAQRRGPASEVASRVVVVDTPLLPLATPQRGDLDGVVVVDAPIEVAVERLVAHRGLTGADARARVAAQMTREERRALAGLVIDNSGPPAALDAQIDGAWEWILARPARS